MFHEHPCAPALARVAATLALTALAVSFAGCGRHAARDTSTATDASAAGRLLGARPGDIGSRGEHHRFGPGFYPLAIGNRWDYGVHIRFTIVTREGPQPPQFTEYGLRVELPRTVQVGTREYFLQEERDPAGDGRGPSAVFLLRQDRSGLYGRDAGFVPRPAAATGDDPRPGELAGGSAALRSYVERAVSLPAERAAFVRAAEQLARRVEVARLGAWGPSGRRPGGPDPGELTMLRYPLFVGARWSVRESPHFARVVVGRERLAVPAGSFTAWRLRGTSELFGPEDRLHLWYAGVGLVRMSFHAESDAVDDSGNVIGRLSMDQDQVLTALDLADSNGPRKFALDAPEEETPR